MTQFGNAGQVSVGGVSTQQEREILIQCTCLSKYLHWLGTRVQTHKVGLVTFTNFDPSSLCRTCGKGPCKNTSERLGTTAAGWHGTSANLGGKPGASMAQPLRG